MVWGGHFLVWGKEGKACNWVTRQRLWSFVISWRVGFLVARPMGLCTTARAPSQGHMVTQTGQRCMGCTCFPVFCPIHLSESCLAWGLHISDSKSTSWECLEIYMNLTFLILSRKWELSRGMKALLEGDNVTEAIPHLLSPLPFSGVNDNRVWLSVLRPNSQQESLLWI